MRVANKPTCACLRVEPFDEAGLTAHLAAHNPPTHCAAAVNFGAAGEGLSLYISEQDGNTVELKGPAREGTRQGQ